MNSLVWSLVKFFTVTVLVGLIGSLAVPTFLGFSLFAGLSVVAQLVLEWVLKRFEYIRRVQYEYERRLDEDAILAANTVPVKCAGCQAPNTIPVIISERNLFRCRKCEAENVIMVVAETALTTKPIE